MSRGVHSPVVGGAAPDRPRCHRGTVTVVVPCRDYGRFLGTCVRSVLAQTGVDFDVTIIDDHSHDDTREVCAALAAADPRVRVVRHTSRHGHIATFNEGLSSARGDYVVLLSADDALAPGALERSARFLDDEPSIGMVYGHPVFFAAEPLPPARCGPGSRHVRSGGEWIARRCREGTNCIASPEVMMRSDTLRHVGYFDTNLPITGDLHLWLRIAAQTDVGYLAGTDQGFYRRHPESMYRSTHRVVGDLEARRQAFLMFLGSGANTVPTSARCERDVRVALANEALWKARRAYDRGRVAETPIGPLREFATATWPDAEELPHARSLRLRMRLGERACRALQPLDWYAIGRHVVDNVRTRRWARTGNL